VPIIAVHVAVAVVVRALLFNHTLLTSTRKKDDYFAASGLRIINQCFFIYSILLQLETEK